VLCFQVLYCRHRYHIGSVSCRHCAGLNIRIPSYNHCLGMGAFSTAFNVFVQHTCLSILEQFDTYIMLFEAIPFNHSSDKSHFLSYQGLILSDYILFDLAYSMYHVFYLLLYLSMPPVTYRLCDALPHKLFRTYPKQRHCNS